ncbi:PucR family transcriptional regulator [Texcoconibacillus texcoconensis]|uniref:Purine catabolism regulator n=1 Tax=Texcoconibacillus texcoconensis TaxID=1095777 RepID=A0A840QS43_9BACI|nr:PucR family transcriptional regulator [Texcoconibacillus texcoconensis]MBB5174185.1 purine catabolism regulator [Texcoconibacillus texcoconensis]
MSITVNDVMNLPVMERVKVKTKDICLEEKVIEWVAVIETPVEHFVRKNEFVLSSAIECEDDPLLLESFVRDVIQSGASALGLATGRHLYTIPDRVVQLANENNVVILEIPWDLQFSDILQVVIKEIENERQSERERAESARQALIDCVLKGQGLDDICRTVYDFIGIPFAIADQMKTIRASQHFSQELLDLFNDEQSSSTITALHRHTLREDHPLYHSLSEFRFSDDNYFQLEITNNHKTQGYLLFQPEKPEQLTWFVMNVLEHALTASALYFVKENAVEMTHIRFKDNFLLDLAKKDTPMSTRLISKAELLGYDLECPYLCIVGDIVYPEDQEANIFNDKPSSSSLHSMNYYIQKEMTNASSILGRNVLATFDEGEIIVFLEAEKETYSKIANQLLDMIERRLHEFIAGTELSWGISMHKDGMFTFHDSYQEAKTALDIGIQQHGTGSRTFFDDTKINRLLMTLSDQSEIVHIVKDTLQPLIENDRKRQTDLIHTFVVYNKRKGNVTQTAKELNLHRQSLLHRLRKIESLTGLSLVDADDAFLLELSVRLWMLRKIK